MECYTNMLLLMQDIEEDEDWEPTIFDLPHDGKRKKSSYSRHIRAPILKRRLNFQSRRFFVFTQTNDDLQEYGSRLEIILP